MKNVHIIEKEINKEAWTNALDAAFKKRSKDVKVDGFRKGAIPKDIYIKKFGIESLYMDAVDAALSIAYTETLKESKVIPVCEPKIDVKEVDEKHVKFEFTIIGAPEVKLGKYKNLGVKREKATVSKEELAAEIDELRSKLAEIVVKENGTVNDGNTAVIKFEGIVDGKALEGGSGDDYPLEIGSHTFIPGFEEGLIGMSIGETKELKLKFPENYTPELKNKEVTFTVTIKGIKERVLPQINEDLYKDLGFKDVKTEEEFNKEVEKTIKERKEVKIEDEYIEACLAEAAKNAKMEINPEIIDEEIHRMMSQFEEQLKMQGLNLEQYFQFTGMTHDDLHKQMEPEATKRVKYRYMLDEISKEEKLTISDADAAKEADTMAKNYNMEKEAFISAIGGMENVKYDMMMRKAIEIVKA